MMSRVLFVVTLTATFDARSIGAIVGRSMPCRLRALTVVAGINYASTFERCAPETIGDKTSSMGELCLISDAFHEFTSRLLFRAVEDTRTVRVYCTGHQFLSQIAVLFGFCQAKCVERLASDGPFVVVTAFR